MDWSRFFSEYMSYKPKNQQYSASVIDTSALTNPIYDDDLALGTYQFTTDNIAKSQPANLWDSLGWGSDNTTNGNVTNNESNTTETVDDTSNDLTIEQYRQQNGLKIEDISQKSANVFAKTVAPIIKSELQSLNSNKNLGLTEEQIENATRRITFQNAVESAYGTSNVANRNNNLGGVKYSSWQQNFNGSQGLKANDGGYYTNYPNIRAFYKALIGHLYGGKYKDALYANSDNDFIQILKKNGYFTTNANQYYSMVFNSLNNKAWWAYKNPEMK